MLKAVIQTSCRESWRVVQASPSPVELTSEPNP